MKLIIVTDIFQMPTRKCCISSLIPCVIDIAHLHLNNLCKRPDLTGEALHHHLMHHGGMGDVVDALRAYDSATVGVGYSAGGTALWRAVQAGMGLRGLFCVSSTRLREEQVLNIETHTYFGANDPHIPSQNWMAETPTRHTVFQGAAHGFYNSANTDFGNIIANDIAGFQARFEIN
jgi:hypothetical protein